MDALDTLLEQAEAERNAALAAFNQARMRRDAARTQAEDLGTYRADYQARWHAQFQRGAALDIVRCYQQFADRLELAITQQDHTVRVSDDAFRRAEDQLAAHELRVASVRKLIERRAAERARVRERHEQKEADEVSQRMALARRGGPSSNKPLVKA